MTDQGEAPKDAIFVEFVETGSVLFHFGMRGTVLPLQLVVVGEYLTTIGKATLLEQREAGRIQVPRTPEPKIILPS